LRDQVRTQLNGDTRKWVSPGRNGVPDQLVMVPPHGIVCVVETKTVDGEVSGVQVREQNRQRDMGVQVFNAYGRNEVDQIIKLLKLKWKV